VGGVGLGYQQPIRFAAAAEFDALGSALLEQRIV
jgi:hypothetical protein